MLKTIKLFLEKAKQERWDLHIYCGGAINIFFIVFGVITNILHTLSSFELIVISSVIGIIIGLGFEIFQSNISGKYIPFFKIFYDLKISSPTTKIKPDITDVIATSVGFLLTTILYVAIVH